jgi:hypothetical protein
VAAHFHIRHSAPAAPFPPFEECGDLFVQVADREAVLDFALVFLVFRNLGNRVVCIFYPTDPHHTSLLREKRARKRTYLPARCERGYFENCEFTKLRST